MNTIIGILFLLTGSSDAFVQSLNDLEVKWDKATPPKSYNFEVLSHQEPKLEHPQWNEDQLKGHKGDEDIYNLTELSLQEPKLELPQMNEDQLKGHKGDEYSYNLKALSPQEPNLEFPQRNEDQLKGHKEDEDSSNLKVLSPQDPKLELPHRNEDQLKGHKEEEDIDGSVIEEDSKIIDGSGPLISSLDDSKLSFGAEPETSQMCEFTGDHFYIYNCFLYACCNGKMIMESLESTGCTIGSEKGFKHLCKIMKKLSQNLVKNLEGVIKNKNLSAKT